MFLGEWSTEPTELTRNDFTKRLINTPKKRKAFEAFKDTIVDGTGQTVAQLYDDYASLRKSLIEQDQSIIVYNNRPIAPIAFRTRSKVKALSQQGALERESNQPVNAFPYRSNMKAYSLHCVAPRGTYYVDLVKFGADGELSRDYYLFVEGNSRYCAIYPANTIAYGDDWGFKGRTTDDVQLSQVAYKIVGGSQSTEAYKRCLLQFLSEIGQGRCRRLRGDAQPAFVNRIILSIYREHGIEFEVVRRVPVGSETEPYHNALSIIDRTVRTIRDCLHELDVLPHYTFIRDIIEQINRAPHTTLTQYGPGFDVSPLMVHEDADLEMFINRAISQHNAITLHQPDYQLLDGEIVAVYNVAGKHAKRRTRVRSQPYRVDGFERGLYRLTGRDGHQMLAPRTWIRRLRGRELELVRSIVEE
jgi:hypothetical protein